MIHVYRDNIPFIICKGTFRRTLTHGPLHVCQGFAHPAGEGSGERAQNVSL